MAAKFFGRCFGLKDLDELLSWELPGELPHLREVFEGLKSFGPPQKFSSSHPTARPAALAFFGKRLLV
jgi:hypothetical protein